MNLTMKKLQLIQERVTTYCSALNTDVPRVIVSKADHELFKIQRRNEMAHGVTDRPAKSPTGVCYRTEKVIFLAADKIKSTEMLDEAIRREMVHLTKPSYYYTRPDFMDRMERLKVGNVRNGRFFTEKRTKTVTDAVKSSEVETVAK